MTSLAMITLLNTAHAWLPFYAYDFQPPRPTYELWYDGFISRGDVQTEMYRQPSPHWTATTDAYQLKQRMPDLEPQSVKAALSSDGTKIEIHAERKVDGCTCTPTIIKEVALPYRPRAEDVEVMMKDDVLSLKLARHAKADVPTPLKVHVLEEPAPDKEVTQAQTTTTRQLRFVPHESATEKTLEEKEKSLTEKFRSAALSSLAATHSSGLNKAASADAKEAMDIAIPDSTASPDTDTPSASSAAAPSNASAEEGAAA